jgi:hypothetical protein
MIRAVSIKAQVEIHLMKLDLVKYREMDEITSGKTTPKWPKWQCEKSLDVH